MIWNLDILGAEHSVNFWYLKCKHPEESQHTKVLSAPLNCETTVTACSDCGEHLTEQKTDCR